MDAMEATFKFVFFLAILAFIAVTIGVFLVSIKITFLVNDPEITVMGVKMVPTTAQCTY